MAGQYSPKQFFRKVSNKFLIDYVERKNIVFDLDLYAIYDHEVDLIFNAFIKLDEVTRHAMESDFQRVHSLATDGGIVALTDEAKEFDNYSFVDTIRDIYGLHNKAMFAFLDSPGYWKAASMFFQASTIATSSWKKLNALPPITTPFTEIDIKLFAQAIGEYFFNKEGRGKRCKIEHYKRGKLDYFCAFPEDFAKSEVEWIRDTLQDLPHTMAFEIIFVYCQEKGTLELYARKNAKNIPHLQKLFAQHILKAELTNFTPVIENKKYDLEAIVEKDFEFNIESDSGIASVRILQATSTCKLSPKNEIIVKNCPEKNKNAVHEQLTALKLKNRYISQVVLKVVLSPSNGKELRSKKVTITLPDKCNLDFYGDDKIIREMLITSGIEPQSLNLSLPCL